MYSLCTSTQNKNVDLVINLHRSKNNQNQIATKKYLITIFAEIKVSSKIFYHIN